MNSLWAASTLKIGQGMFFDTGMFGVLIILSTLILANILRRKIPFLRRSMMPTAVIGGLLIMAIRAILQLFDVPMFSTADDNALFFLTYHLLPVGFIALSLRDKQSHEGNELAGVDSKIVQTNPVRTGAMIVSGYMLYAIIGITLTVVLGTFLFGDIMPGSGILLSLGFGQGPTQAVNGGTIFEDAGMANGLQFGLAIAALGFVWASIGGVVLLNIIAKKRGVKLRDRVKTSGEVTSGLVEEADEIPLSESIDKFSMQVCLVGFIYLLTMGFCMLLQLALQPLGKTGSDVMQVFWGFNFCFGIAFAMLFKAIIKRLRKHHLMNRKYVNNYMLNRIGGLAFDVLIIASLASLEVAALGMQWIPLLIITSAGGIGMLFYVRYICKKMYASYYDEAFVTMYGMLTGTLSNGIILLRELDPEFKTPAAMDQVLGAATGLIFGIPMLFLIAFATRGPSESFLNYYFVLAAVFVYFFFL
ncbi:MAG: hypothetical protein FWE62_02495, partial [Firmicutes bacterium]|nr:hypothetical protein [Bacillota bacterium]